MYQLRASQIRCFPNWIRRNVSKTSPNRFIVSYGEDSSDDCKGAFLTDSKKHLSSITFEEGKDEKLKERSVTISNKNFENQNQTTLKLCVVENSLILFKSFYIQLASCQVYFTKVKATLVCGVWIK